MVGARTTVKASAARLVRGQLTTVDARLLIEGMLAARRSGQSARVRHELRGQALCLRRFLWWRREARATLTTSAGHDATEKVAWTVTNIGRLWLCMLRSRVLCHGSTARVEFSLEGVDALLVAGRCQRLPEQLDA